MTYQIAILGTGVGTQHLEALMNLPDRFVVAWVCDLDLARAQALADRVVGCRATTEIDVVLADDDVEVVDICLPPALHVPVTLRALEAGKHVVCEKPLAGSVHAAEQVANAARVAARLVVPVFQYRYGPAMVEFEALREAGLVGAPLAGTLETHWDREADYYAVPWRGTWEHELGGAVLIHAIHGHDLIGRVCGPIREVSAITATLANPVETEDTAALAFRTGRGALVTSSLTLGAAGNSSRLRFVFQHLTTESGRSPYAPTCEPWSFLARDPARQDEVDEVLARVRNGLPVRPGFCGLFWNLAQALDGYKAELPTIDDGIASIELAAAIYAADRSGKRISLPIDKGLPSYVSLRP